MVLETVVEMPDFQRRAKASIFSGCNSHPAIVVPAGSSRSDDGGNKVLSWVSLLFDVRADNQRDYLRVAFCELGVQWFVCCQHGLGQHQWFSLATLVDIRSPKAPHCLIRRLNR